MAETSNEDQVCMLINRKKKENIYIIKIKIHSSCEIEYFVINSSLQAVCDTPIIYIIYIWCISWVLISK